MTTVAVDTNALLAVLYDDEHADASEAALREAYRAGRLVIAPIVYGELSADGRFEHAEDLDRFLADMSIDVTEPSRDGLFRAGETFRTYSQRRPDGLRCPDCGTERTAECSSCGRNLSPRQHIAADFVIGGHAITDADQLITFDTSFYRSYFPELTVTP